MSEANEFRLYAEEAMRDSFNAETEIERAALEDLACMWARAALVSERLFEARPTHSRAPFLKLAS